MKYAISSILEGFKISQDAHTGHNAWDIVSSTTRELKAPFDVEVIASGVYASDKKHGYPTYIWLKKQGSPSTNKMVWLHCPKDKLPAAGAKFSKGEVVSEYGDVGTLPGTSVKIKPHLHLEVYFKGKMVSPSQLFSKS